MRGRKTSDCGRTLWAFLALPQRASGASVASGEGFWELQLGRTYDTGLKSCHGLDLAHLYKSIGGVGPGNRFLVPRPELGSLPMRKSLTGHNWRYS